MDEPSVPGGAMVDGKFVASIGGTALDHMDLATHLRWNVAEGAISAATIAGAQRDR
jgi:hypothetical protein